MNLFLREARRNDLPEIIELYSYLHDEIIEEIDSNIQTVWNSIIDDKRQHILVGTLHENIVSSCVLVIVPNLTHEGRPYGFIENVVTKECFRCKGYARAVLDYAKQLAHENNCYKLMLMTGHKDKATLDFYKKSGFNSDDKTAFIQWL